jgi:uncharacterized protein (TIGR01777 family)
MRILIPGGTGLLGRALALDLAKDGHEVIVLSRNPETADRIHPSVRYERWDGQSAEGWAQLVDGADALVNLAGESIGGESTFRILFQKWSAAKKRRILDSRLKAGRAIIEAVAKAKRKPLVVIQPVGSGYYGIRTTGEVDETAPPGDDFLADVVKAWEASTKALEAPGLRRVIFRTGIVMSTEGGTLPMILLPFRLFVGGPLGSGRQWLPWVHITDFVRAVRFALDHPEVSGAFNLAAPDLVTNAEFGRAVGRQLRRPYWFPVPAFALRLLLGEKAVLILEGQRVVPRRLVGLGFRFEFPDLASALADLRP